MLPSDGEGDATVAVQRLASRRAAWALWLSVLLTAGLFHVPYGGLIAYPLVLLSTFIHEMGHGLTALVLGGNFVAFHIWPDGSGAAVWNGDVGVVGKALVAAGGLMGPAGAAAIFFLAGSRASWARWGLWAFAVVLLASGVLVVRNLFGLIFVFGSGIVAGLFARFLQGGMAQFGCAFLGVQLGLAVFSRADYLFTPVARTSMGVMPSDVGRMAEVLPLPYWFWGILCGGTSVLILAWGIRRFLRLPSD